MNSIVNKPLFLSQKDSITIAEKVADAYSISITDLLSKSRQQPLPEARKMVYYLLFNKDYTISRIARLFGISRDIVYIAIREIPFFIDTYPEVKAKHKAIKEKLNGY